MGQETVVVVIPFADRSALRQRLASGTFEFRSVPHALFSVKGEGVVATLYKSGKFVVQGPDPGLFLSRFTEGAAPAVRKTRAPEKSSAPPDATTLSTLTTIGSDETGKGDYFGPLVVAAVRLEPERSQEVLAAGVMDSKKIRDPRALQLGAWLRDEVPYSLQTLMPEAYNRRWKVEGLTSLLSSLHAAAIRDLASPGDRVVIDQFTKKDEIGPALSDLNLAIEQRPRAESELAVAAASIIARAEFLVCLKELGDEYDQRLPKGAGDPVDAAGAEFAASFGMERLGEVAKVHFKNTEKVRSRLQQR